MRLRRPNEWSPQRVVSLLPTEAEAEAEPNVPQLLRYTHGSFCTSTGKTKTRGQRITTSRTMKRTPGKTRLEENRRRRRDHLWEWDKGKKAETGLWNRRRRLSGVIRGWVN